jgi:hypothetical protein
VSIEGDKATSQRTLIKPKVQEVLTKLERVVPEIGRRIGDAVKIPENAAAEGPAGDLHSPSLFFVISDGMSNPLRWSFVVEGCRSRSMSSSRAKKSSMFGPVINCNRGV